MPWPFIVCAAITLISATVSLGFSVASFRTSTGQAGKLALYACARSVPLFLVSVVPLMSGSVGWLQAAAWSMILVQAFDAAIGVAIGDRMKTLGPAATALVNLGAVLWLNAAG